MSADTGLDVKAVVNQFRESEQALQQLRERLRGLVLAEEEANQAVGAIDEATEALKAAAAALERVVGEVQDARTTTVAALDAARVFLEGTDLGALRSDLARVAEEARQGTTELRGELRSLADRIPEAEAVRAELEELKGRIPVRTRRKLGIS